MIKKSAFTILLFCRATMIYSQEVPRPVYTSDAFSVFPDRVVQDRFQAKALSRTEIVSDYQSMGNDYVKPRIDFKFSINGKDNEMLSGRDHHFNCLEPGGRCETPVITFGEQLDDDRPVPSGVYLGTDTKWRIRLDMRKVFNDFASKGYYEAFNNSRIYTEDFKGVYVAGGTAPLTWDFDNLQHFKNLQLKDEDGDHIYEVELTLNPREAKRSVNPRWNLSVNTRDYPQYRSDYMLVDALYNLSLEEMVKAVEEDSTLRTGKEWAGVWTRDVSYSIILSMAILQPKVAQYSLMRKVKDGVIVQDTGTGGAYPVSTDRMIWAIAAWEIYKVTGDRDWLESIYPVIKRSVEADLKNALDDETGLVKGESSFLDWREQTYPQWMQPADIYESRCLGTNAVHYQANIVLAAIAKTLGKNDVATIHEQVAVRIRKAINDLLWLNDKQYYGQFLYGRTFGILSPRSDALGEALCVLFGIADLGRQKEIVANTPVNVFGIPCIYPQIPDIPPYHNNGVWPFVQSYWAMASAKAANEQSVLASMAAIWRPAALFLTNKENFVASTGDFAATQINSDNMLWSLAGNIAMIYKVLFGIEYHDDHISFKPFVPEALKGERTLTNYKYRGAVLDIEMEGFGNAIRSITMDGKPLANAVIPSSLKGRHQVTIILADKAPGGKVNMGTHHVSPASPHVFLQDTCLSWTRPGEAVRYKIIRNGMIIKEQTDTTLQIPREGFQEYQVIAVDMHGYESFASEPLAFTPLTGAGIVEAETCNDMTESHRKGFNGDGYVRTTTTVNPALKFEVQMQEKGTYAIDFRYANGHGPVNTDNKCALRTLKVNGDTSGTIVLPQRGKDEWSEWGFSNRLIVDLGKGTHEITLDYEPHNANMNGLTNEALVDFIRIVRIK